MRWSNLTIDADERAVLPGYRDAATVRHFDAPEALDTRFYEVRAKSALNRVPEKSRMPFRWTINPYRGCSHACTYCAWGGTPVLMADGRTRPLAEIRTGDEIYGTRVAGRHRRYVKTTVLDHWSSIKPAVRTKLADGTELITSGDHRFLTGRGWKHVTDAAGGRPHLTTSDALLGTGAFAEGPRKDEHYRRGYLCGMVRGDGTPGHAGLVRTDGRAGGAAHAFRLALADDEAVDRARRYLAEAAVATNRFRFAAAVGARRACSAIRTDARAGIERIEQLIAWPADPTDEWRRGYLAGIFDAAGSCRLEALRISSCDPDILRWIEACLRHLCFGVALDRPVNANGLVSVRIRGGMREWLRFLHLTDPAISRKRNVEGRGIKPDADLRVMSVEPLGTAMRLYDVTTGTGDFIADGVVSHNCFARPTHRYLDMDAGRDFERQIVVKVNVPEVLAAELARPSWKGEHVAMGTNTDPYQWVEGRYELMRGIWTAMRDARNPASVLTKSPLLLRDLDLLLELAEVAPVSANFSIPTLDEKVWRASEPRTPNPRARLEAVAELNRAGIPTGVLVAPLMPGINDSPRQVEAVLRAVAEAGATGVSGIGLHLRGETRTVFMEWLRSYRPDLVERYERLYDRSAYLPDAEQRRLQQMLRSGPARAAPRFTRQASEVQREIAARRAQREGTARRRSPAQTSLF
ncbi:MAG: radical SAM protein [Solirubrobacteraceae bacterium]